MVVMNCCLRMISYQSSWSIVIIKFANGCLLVFAITLKSSQNGRDRLHPIRHRLPQKRPFTNSILFRTHHRHKDQKLIKDFISLKFKVDEIDEFQTQLKEIDRHAKAYWKVNHSFDFYMNEHQLRKKFLVLEAYSVHKHLLGSLKMNLYSLWTGPYHLDFQLEMEKCKTARISFNFKISQGVHLSFENLQTEMIPKQAKFYEDCFAFTLQAITGQQLEEAVSPYIVKIKANPKEERYNNNQTNTVFVARNKIVWSQQLCKEYPLPKFDKKIAYYEIYSSALHIVFFQVLPGLSDANELRYQMESECFISLTKLMTLEYVQFKDPVTNITYIQRTVELLEKTWLHGEEKGKVRIKFKFIMQSHLKQMQACVRTQNGILASSPVFYQGSDTKHSCAEIQQLKKLHTDIQKEWINLQRNNRLHNNVIMIKENILRISNLLAKELAVLEKSSKESLLFYEYLNQEELYSAQRFFIDLAFKVLTYIHQDNPDICEISWSILIAILKRGEFKLSQVGFSQAQKIQIQENKISDPVKMKIQVALKYQQLLNHLLKETLALLHYKGEEVQRVFAEFFCSYAYFRIPLFRQHILTITKRQNDPEIPQWRGTEININQQDKQWNASDETDDFFGILFDWEVNFYEPIMGDERYKLHKNQLQSILLEDRWKLRLSRRSGAFFTFLENLVVEIEYVSVVSKHIKWYRMPGYNRLLYAFLVEMQQQKLKNYTERFKKTCVRLLANEKLLNIFVVILLKKTNVNDPEAVDIAIQMIDSFFNSIKANNRTIVNTFDYMYFLEGLKILLNSEVESCVSRALLFIYHNLETFSQQFGLELIIYLLSSLFFKFFFHWSFTLRHIFQILLLTKISHYSQIKSLPNNPKNSENSNNNTSMNLIIKDRYDSLMKIIKRQIQPTFQQTNKDMFLEKVLYKKMRSHLCNKKKQQAKKESVIKSLKDIFLPDLHIKNKSAGNGGIFIPHKLLYFKEEDMVIVPPKEELRYVKIALNQYTSLAQEIAKSIKEDPHFMPEIKINKMVDEKQICPIVADQW